MALKRVVKYTSFLITRHPLSRLVSAYYDKFSVHSQYPMFKQEFGKRMAFEVSQMKYKNTLLETGFGFQKRLVWLELNQKVQGSIRFAAVIL